MVSKRLVQTAFYTAVGCVWPITTFAAGATLSQTINDIPASAWVIVFILSVVSGLVSLLQRLKDEMMKSEDETRIRIAWRWFLSAHMVGALFAGLLGFFAAEAFQIKDMLEAVFIAFISYGGARFMDRMADGISDGVVNRFIGFVGGKPPSRED